MVKEVYCLTRTPEFSRDFLLVEQARTSATSILFNISEGFERDGNREFLNFLSIAKGSCGELEATLTVASDQGYISSRELAETIEKVRRVSRLLAGLMRHLRDSPLRGQKYKTPD
ncbi:MAG: four helix bundle protein [Acidobacteriota bacterium]